MSIYKLVTIDQRYIAETIARTGSEQLLNKVARSFVGLYSQEESWYIPLRANLGKKKPEGAYFETPFETNNSHFKRPGLDYEKSIFVPIEYTIEIRNTLPPEQSELIFSRQEEIRKSFEEYVLGVDQLDKNSPNYKFSTVPLFPEGLRQIKEIQMLENQQSNYIKQETLFDNIIDVLPKEAENNISETKSDNQLFWYSLDLRPVSIGTHPNTSDNPALVDTGYINSKNRKYGAVGYKNALKEIDTTNYDLTYIGMADTAKNAIFSDSKSTTNHQTLEIGQILYRTMETSDQKINEVAKITSVDDQGVRIEWVGRVNGKGPYVRNDQSNLEVYQRKEIENEWELGRKTHEKIFEKAVNGKSKNHEEVGVKKIINQEKQKEIHSIKTEETIQNMIKRNDFKTLSVYLKESISSYLEIDTFINYLNFVSRFHKYSDKNVRLLLAQNPKTTQVAGRNKWKKIGREIINKPQTLYVSTPGYKVVKDKKGNPIKDKDGQVVKEKFFFFTPVFDVSQTVGEPIQKPIHELKGDFESPDQFVKVFKAIENISPVPIKIEPIEGNEHSYFDNTNKQIVVKNGLGEGMTLKTLIHEIIHTKYHSDSSLSYGDEKYRQQEFEAESVAYIVSNHLGIDSSDYSFTYLDSWTKQEKSLDSFAESLNRITRDAQQIIDSLDKSLSLSFAMSGPANKFEERVAKAQGRDIQPVKSTKKSAAKEIEPDIPKENRPRLNP